MWLNPRRLSTKVPEITRSFIVFNNLKILVGVFRFQQLFICVVTALQTLVEKRITGFPVIDDDWKLVSVFFFPLNERKSNQILCLELLGYQL